MADWLGRDRDVAAVARVRRLLPMGDGTMSGAGEVIGVLLTHEEALAALLISDAAWRQSRRSKKTITLKVGDRELSVSDCEGSRSRSIDMRLREVRPGRR